MRFRRRSLMASKCLRYVLAFCLTVWILIAGVYFTFLKHPPADEILRSQASKASLDVSEYELDPSKPHSVGEISRAIWNKWIVVNRFVSIGTIYDSCEEDLSINSSETVTVGKIILKPDPETGGIKTSVYINTTFSDPLIRGKIHVIVHYNTKEFYSNSLDLCEVAEGDCPYSKGPQNIHRDNKVPAFIPTGQYDVKVRVTNQNKDLVLCAESTLIL